MDFEKELSKRLLDERENESVRVSYNMEIEFYRLVSSGNVEMLNDKLDEINSQIRNSEYIGVLSSNGLTNRKYHAVVMVSLISRFCIERGLDIAVSYALSDIFIEKVDTLNDIKSIDKLCDRMAICYCKKMSDLRKKSGISRHIVMTIDYVRAHIKENISVESIANELTLNASYLSKIFKQEMGITLNSYIRIEKIKVACDMLSYLDESSLSIANYLGFSSQSYFIQVFKKTMGTTPEEYRKQHYQKSWMSQDK